MTNRNKEELEDIIMDLIGRASLSEEDVSTLQEAEKEMERINENLD